MTHAVVSSISTTYNGGGVSTGQRRGSVGVCQYWRARSESVGAYRGGCYEERRAVEALVTLFRLVAAYALSVPDTA
eukprot:1762809-Rhodomonas_salina.5